MRSVQSITLISSLAIAVNPASPTSSSTDDNMDQCKPGWSGYDCAIPYESCKDGRTKCFNNSKCIRNMKIDPGEGDFTYGCDCSYAESVSSFAGVECEHAATVYCEESKHYFCTNDGTCGSYILYGELHVGCHCPVEFMGAHCQYLKAEMQGGMPGEAAVPEIADNFYTEIIREDSSNVNTTWIIVVIVVMSMTVLGLCVLCLKFFLALKTLDKYRDPVVKTIHPNNLENKNCEDRVERQRSNCEYVTNMSTLEDRISSRDSSLSIISLSSVV